MRRLIAPAAIALLCALVLACSDAEKERVRQTTKATYDAKTGKLTELTFDRNRNGVIDTWIDMDGTRPVQSRIDLNEDGKIDRWEYYDASGKLTRVGFSRKDNGKPDAWAYADPDGKMIRVEISSTGDEKKIDRWEHYNGALAGPNGDPTGALVSVEEDTNGDGRPDKWETYENGSIKTVAFDEGGTGHPTRRLTYAGGQLVLLESDPDGQGGFRTRKTLK
jgi:hypothetical protein